MTYRTGDQQPAGKRLCRRALRLAAALMLAAAVPAAAQSRPEPVRETAEAAELHRVVAGYLAAFAEHIRWPAGVPPTGRPFRIGLLADPEAGRAIAQALADRAVHGRPVEVVQGAEAAAGNCHVILIERPGKAAGERLRASLQGRPVLLVGFGTPETGSGAAIDLVVQPDGTLRYRLAIGALKAAGLRPSPELLKLSLPRPLP